MAEFLCPECRAAIDLDPQEPSGPAACPFCGAAIGTRDLTGSSAVDDAETQGEEQAQEEGAQSPGAESLSRPLPPCPAGSAIRVVESTDEQLVLFIPAGGKGALGIGCFALFWNLFMVVFTSAAIRGAFRGQNNDTGVFGLVCFFSLFWAVGLGMAWFWSRLRFERTFLLLDRERIVVQRVLFGRKRISETRLAPESRAELVESYKQNNRPVYRIEVPGDGGTAKFGTALTDEEKDWLVERVNEFLGVSEDEEADEEEDDDGGSDADDGSAEAPTAKPDSARATTAPPAIPAVGFGSEPVSLEAGECVIDVVESSPDRLRLVYRMSAGSPIRRVLPWVLFALSAGLFGFLGYLASDIVAGRAGFSLVARLVFLVPFAGIGLAMCGLALFVLVGRTTIDLTRETLSRRWDVGPIGRSASLAAPALESVRVVRDPGPRSGGRKHVRGSGAGASGKAYVTCVAAAGSKKLSLTFFNDEPLAQEIALLVTGKLDEMGYRVRHG